MGARATRLRRTLLGDRPTALLWLASPTLLALVLDLALRGGALAGYATQGKLIYASSLLVSMAFWVLPLWGAAFLQRARGGPRARLATAGLGASGPILGVQNR